MKRKRLLCAVLALVLLFSAQPAAAALAPNARSIEITADCRIPIIQVTVPSSGEVYINPLELPVDIGTGRRYSGQIFSTPACIANESEVPMQVDLTLTASVREGSTMTLASAPTGGEGTAKSAFVYFEMQQSDTDNPKRVYWDPKYDPAKHIVIQDGMSIKKPKIMTLPPMTREGWVADGGYAPFRLTGDAVRDPTDEWTEKDGIDVTVAFTFTPIFHS
ncbi:MAG: hypothetical protein K2P26_11060 [Oscillospiraceae bacterium]|nr:hypothetical protein [Oscillospiraceae bacterium]